MTKDIRKLLSGSKLTSVSVERSFLDCIKKLLDDGKSETVSEVLKNFEIPPLGSEFTNELGRILCDSRGHLTPAPLIRKQD